jgi:hypothetical protein
VFFVLDRKSSVGVVAGSNCQRLREHLERGRVEKALAIRGNPAATTAVVALPDLPETAPCVPAMITGPRPVLLDVMKVLHGSILNSRLAEAALRWF